MARSAALTRPCIALALVVAALAAATSLAPAASARPRTPSCASLHTLLLGDRHVRVYTVRDPSGAGTNYYACASGRRKPFTLGFRGAKSGESSSSFTVRLAGWYVAIDSSQCGSHYCVGGTATIDMRAYRFVHAAPLGPTDMMPLFFFSPVTSLVLTPTGTFAWIRPSLTGPGHDVYLWPADGQLQRLDSGPAIDPRSLAIGGNTIYWIDAGTTHSAPIS